jgi:triacylglycerol esterase/lipase EstA (alpha/beta hydrolase family)
LKPFSTRRLGVALSLFAALAVPSAAAAKTGPVISNFSAAFAWGLVQPNLDPAGSNNWACKPTGAHPRPVVLLHGTYANRFNSFAALSPAIRRQGYCVFALDYGKGKIAGLNGARSVRVSSLELAAFVDKVLAATGAPKVDIVGYSQGGLVARSYLKYDGGSDAADPSQNKVGSLIGMSADNHGTTLGGLTQAITKYRLQGVVASTVGGSATDQIAGSPFLTALSAGSETVPGVAYTLIGTKTDEISSPFRNAFLTAGPGATVTNITLQSGCPTDLSDHFNITYSRRATAFVLKALDPAYGGGVPCQVLLPGL